MGREEEEEGTVALLLLLLLPVLLLPTPSLLQCVSASTQTCTVLSQEGQLCCDASSHPVGVSIFSLVS